jgi:DNA-binding NtrC family response regulator
MTAHVTLLVSGDANLTAAIETGLSEGVDLLKTLDLEAASRAIAEVRPNAALVDVRGQIDGGHAVDRALERFAQLNPGLPVILVVDSACPETIERRAAVDGMHLLHDNNLSPLKELVAAFTNATPKSDAVPATLDAPPLSAAKESTHPIATNSPPLRRMLDDLTVAAAHDVTILLIGETGSGKTWLSKLIHESSPRRDEPFVHVACGALPRDLIESELFGHVKGAFTSAHADKDGKFIAARKGTILLDEIDVLGPEQQVKLLRVIETGEFEPVGSNRTFKSQARLVVASNLELQPLVEQGRFRPDLYYRLNMMKFDLPPLRKRKADIVPLAQGFIARFQEKHGVRIQRVDAGLLDALIDYPWPGNVRELEHVIQRAVIYCRDGVLTASNLPPHILAGQAGPANDPSVHLGTRSTHRDPSLGSQVAITEKDIIEQALSRNNFSRTITARELGISRVTLYNKMRKYQMMK